MIRRMFHTQERWLSHLNKPVLCTSEIAWLGEAFYFWYDEDDATFWGLTFKRATGYYEVYAADINFDNVLHTVFNEEHYVFWLKNIDKAIDKFVKSGIPINLKTINTYFKDKGIWTCFDGIMFQDIPASKQKIIVPGLYYKKRIQIGIYNEKIITNYMLHFGGKCV